MEYTIIYYTVRTCASYLINHPKGLIKHYEQLYNRIFNQ